MIPPIIMYDGMGRTCIQVLETPGRPQVPETPESPRTSWALETSTPETLTPEAPQTPQALETPEAPGTPQALETPKAH